MSEPQKAKWHFIYSETLKQRIAFDEVSGWLFCKDGTKYSPQELAIMTDNWQKSHEVPLAVHLLKKRIWRRNCIMHRKIVTGGGAFALM